MKLPILSVYLLTIIVLLSTNASFSQSATKKYHLIAHRGGVVDAHTRENSRESIAKAITQGYWMVEIDLRLTRDGMLIINHDRDLKRYYNVERPIAEMTWNEIQSASAGKVLSLEDALKLCTGKINVMIDNKINGNDTLHWQQLITLLKKYNLYENALTIGTDESTEYFTGKIKLSCTRQQLEINMHRADYKPANYYLFSNNISKADASWAKQHNILAVGVINAWALKTQGEDKPRQLAHDMKTAGVTHFQIDAEYAPLFED